MSLWRLDVEQALRQAAETNKRIKAIESSVNDSVYANYANARILDEMKVIVESSQSVVERWEAMAVRDQKFTRRVTFLLILLATLEVAVPVAQFVISVKMK